MMSSYFRNIRTSLLFSASILTCAHVQASNDLLQEQVIEPGTIQQQTLLTQEYNKLFLDEWQTLVLAGENDKAVNVALATELSCRNAMLSEGHKRNIALIDGLYGKSKDRSLLKPGERFSPFYFRMYHSNPNKLVELHEENVRKLQQQLNNSEEYLAKLRHKEQTSPKIRVRILQEIENYFDLFNSLRMDIITRSKDQDVISLVNEINEEVNTTLKLLHSLSPRIYGTEETKQVSEQLESLSNKMFERLTSAGLRQKAASLRAEYESKTDIPQESLESLDQLCYSMEQFSTSPRRIISRCLDWLSTHPDCSLDKIETDELSKRTLHLEDLRKDTQSQIEKEIARINFIKTNYTFFQTQFRPRAELLGITNLEDWFAAQPSRPLGDGIIVGVIDIFANCIQTNKILNKAINPAFVGTAFIKSTGEAEKNHGIGVASIIVSDEVDPLDGDGAMTIGVAPGARFEMIDYTDVEVDINTRKLYPDTCLQGKVQWTTEKMAGAVSELVNTGAIAELGFTMKMIGDSPVLKSKARVLNYSIANSGMEKSHWAEQTVFEGLSEMPVLLELMKSRLLVQALANDGIQVGNCSQHRLLKAFALCPETSPHFLVVTNLMRDGITLNPTSNAPGEEEYLQARTLSAPGTELTAAILTTDGKDFEYYDNGGTSFATPHVTGVAAVVLSNYPSLTPAQLAQCLLDSATPLLVNADNVPSELSKIMSKDLKQAFEKAADAPDITIQGQKINRQDWLRGKACFGQGRVHLGNALKLAATIDMDRT